MVKAMELRKIPWISTLNDGEWAGNSRCVHTILGAYRHNEQREATDRVQKARSFLCVWFPVAPK
jgi:hypothetical protein